MSKNPSPEELKEVIAYLEKLQHSMKSDLERFLQGGGDTYYGIDVETVGQAMLLAATWLELQRIEKSSHRLEKLTWVLVALTSVLAFLTAALFVSAVKG